MRVPLGVIAVVYEARPNVTIDAAALCLKSGNAIVLRGSARPRTPTPSWPRSPRGGHGRRPARGALTLVAGGGRGELAELATQTGVVDLIIPRGGEGLKAALKGVATVPVIYAASGNNHVYVDAGADLDAALEIVLNAKCQRPGTCNAAEKLLVHADEADELPAHGARCPARRRGDPARRRPRPGARPRGRHRARRPKRTGTPSTWPWRWQWAWSTRPPRRWRTSTATAADTPRRSSPGTSRRRTAFELGVDAACVYVNASTRFTDGGQFGKGAEIGNSTQKLHARGPIGLSELCTFKYLVQGDGHVRA